MSTQGEHIKALLTVRVSTGQAAVHTYDVPAVWDEGIKFVEMISAIVDVALMKRKPPVLVLQNPSVVYNVDYVVSVEATFIGEGEFKELAEKLSRKRIGFIKD